MSETTPGTITDARNDNRQPDRLWKVIREKCEQILTTELQVSDQDSDFDDLLSETTMAFWLCYRDDPNNFSSGGAVYAWLRVVLLNSLRDRWRRRERVELHKPGIEARQRCLEERAQVVAGDRAHLLEFVQQLPEDKQAVLHFYLTGLSLRNIAGELACSLHKVRVDVDEFKATVTASLQQAQESQVCEDDRGLMPCQSK